VSLRDRVDLQALLCEKAVEGFEYLSGTSIRKKLFAAIV
jgi:hypothetical protein